MIDDDGKLKQRFINKRVNAAKEGVKFNLSFEQFCSLLEDAKIKSSDCGIKSYHLARNNDQGSYEIGNCRFLHYLENYQEKYQRLGHIVRQPGKDWETHVRDLEFKASENRKKFEESAHASYLNEKNSQFGSFWITNDIVDQKWKPCLGPIPENFRPGRKTNSRYNSRSISS